MPARQHLNDAADLLVAADDRVELSSARQLGEIASVFLERLVLLFGVLRGGRGAPRTSRSASSNFVATHAELGQKEPAASARPIGSRRRGRAALGLRPVEDVAQGRTELSCAIAGPATAMGLAGEASRWPRPAGCAPMVRSRTPTLASTGNTAPVSVLAQAWQASRCSGVTSGFEGTAGQPIRRRPGMPLGSSGSIRCWGSKSHVGPVSES